MIAYIAVLMVMVNLCLGVFLKTSRISAMGTGILDRMQVVREIRRDFTESAMLADAVVPEVGEYRTGPERLVLRTSGADGSTHYIVFGRFGDEPRLGRVVLAKTKDGLEVVRGFEYPLDFDVITFSYDAERPSRARLVSLHLDIGDAPGEGTAPPGHTFQGAIRGRGGPPESDGES